MKPINVHGCKFDTVQEALLWAMRVHEITAASPAYANYPEDQLRYLWNNLNAIRDGIAARAPSDEEMV